MATATPVIKALRNFLAGLVQVQSRYVRELVARTQPPPNLPGGVAHRLAANYYYDRDVRRAMAPPMVVYGKQKRLEASLDSEGEVPEIKKPCTPGKVW